MRRLLRILSVTLITAGIVILADAGVTLAWNEPLSAVYGRFQQSAAQDELNTVERQFLDSPDLTDLGRGRSQNIGRRADELAGIYSKQIGNGQAIGTIRVPSVGIDFVLIQGTETADLQKGPGHYPATGLPGQGRTIGIAGHRTTYAAPFRKIADVGVGDEIVLEMPYGTFTYGVRKTEIVEPSDVGVVDDVGTERVVLTACHPLYSAAQRYVVTADLTDTKLVRGGGATQPD